MSQSTTTNSPAAGGSPSAEEESAQRLLDQWYGNVNSIEAQPFDEFGVLPNADWDGGVTYGNSLNPINANGFATSGIDSSIWENLVNQLRKQ